MCGVCIVHPSVGVASFAGGERQQAHQHPAAPLSPAPTPQPPPLLKCPAPRSRQSSQSQPHTPTAPPVPRLLPPGCVMSVGCGAAPFCLGFGGWGGHRPAPPARVRGAFQSLVGACAPTQPQMLAAVRPQKTNQSRARACAWVVWAVWDNFLGSGWHVYVCVCVAARQGAGFCCTLGLHVRVLLLAAGHCGAMTLCAVQNHGTKAQRNQKIDWNRCQAVKEAKIDAKLRAVYVLHQLNG